MSNIQDVLDSQKKIEGNLLSKMAEFERQLHSTSAQGTDSKPNLDKLMQEFNDFKGLVTSMFKLLNTQIQSLTANVDYLDNQQRLNALLFSGIQECDKEDCAATILNIIHTKLNRLEVQPTSIYVCHRLGAKTESRSRPIIVRFTDIHTRNAIWSAKKLLKSSPVVISEFLTKIRQAIFISARKHFGITRCWSQDGNIFVKLPDNDRKRITSAHELDRLIAKFPTTGIISTVSPKSIPALTSSPKPITTSQPAAPVVVPAPPVTRRNTAAAKAKPSKPQ